MEEILPFLEGVYYLATCEDGQPHVRPFDAACIYEGDLYIGTNKNKSVYQQILKNPKVEIFHMGSGSIRFQAEAFPIEDQAKNTEIYQLMGKNPEDHEHAVLKLLNIHGEMLDPMSGTIKRIDS